MAEHMVSTRTSSSLRRGSGISRISVFLGAMKNSVFALGITRVYRLLHNLPNALTEFAGKKSNQIYLLMRHFVI
jgi:hypothetical protein